MTTKTPVLVDCDTGVDDAMALLYLLERDDIDVVAITSVFGNNTAAIGAHNTMRVLELVGREDIPVAVGAEQPLVGDRGLLATRVHGADGLGDSGLPAEIHTAFSELSAVDLILQTATEYAGALRILALAPLTNLALALEADPELVARVHDVVAMGGAANAPGNRSAAAEANIVHDPEAAQKVIEAGWPVTLVPLDVTMTELLTEDHVEQLLEANTGPSRFVAATSEHYFGFYGEVTFGVRCAACHDALAAAILTGEVVPIVAPMINVVVDCTDGPGRGATICDTRSRYRGWTNAQDPNCTVVLQTDGTFPDALVASLSRWST